ncbi:MAG: hypothetical protein KDB57_04280 [Solirubrobacterales bacterium]|nr:hypothetical protein [Solirubrobacterales bacterium]
MRIPTVDQYPDAEELAVALSEALRTAPLGGVKQTETREVREWAEAQGMGETGDDLLAAYNQAAEDAPTEIEVELGQMVGRKAARSAVIRLLGITGTSDEVRLLALGVLEGRMESEDAGDFARANLKQRPQVIGPAVKVLAGIPGSEALFALSKIFSRRDDEAGLTAGQIVHSVRERSLEIGELETAAAGGQPVAPAAELEPRELLLAAMSMPPRRQSELAQTGHGRELIERMVPAAVAEGSRIRELSSGSGGLHSYDAAFRDEMIDLALTTSMAPGEEFQTWARENLFRREDLERMGELAPFLPGSELAGYAKRALTTQNRRGPRAERAALALNCLRKSDGETRRALREEAVACLDEENADLRSEALRLLSVDSEELDASMRSRLATVYDGLPPAQQSRISADLRLEGKGPDNHESFLRWVKGAGVEDVRDRLQALLERWAGRQADTSPEQAVELIQVFGEGFALLEPAEQSALIPDLVGVSAGWIRSQKGRIVESTSSLMRWQRFRGIVAAEIGEFINRLRVEQAKGLVREALGLRQGSLVPELLHEFAEGSRSSEEVQRVLLPVFTEAVRTDAEAVGKVIRQASGEARSWLLVAGLIADIESRSKCRQLSESLKVGAPESLVERQRIVLDALADARKEADGNDRIVVLLDEIGQTIGETSEGQSDQPAVAPSGKGAGTNLGDPPDAVLAWRETTTDRYPGLVVLDSQILLFAPDSGTDDGRLLALMKDLDRRSHSKRVAPVSEREHYRDDLVRLLDSVLDSELVAIEEAGSSLKPDPRLGDSGAAMIELLDGGRPELRELFWQRANERGDESQSNQLATALQRCADQPGDDSALSMLSAALDASDSGDAERAVRELSPEQTENAWRALSALFSIDLRNENSLRTQERDQESKIGRQMAADFELRFEAIERLLSSYFRLRERLAESGWRRVEDRLGRTYRRDRLDPTEYEIRKDDGGDLFVVKTMGIKFGGQTVSRAIVEPAEGRHAGQEDPFEADEGGPNE